MTGLEKENDESADYLFVFFSLEYSIVSFLGQSFALFGVKGKGTKDESEPLYILEGHLCVIFFFLNTGNWMSLRVECWNACLVWI